MLQLDKIIVGDKIRCIKNCSLYAEFLPNIGEIGTVSQKQFNSIRIKWENKKISQIWNWFFDGEHSRFNWYESASSLELVTEELKTGQLEFEF